MTAKIKAAPQAQPVPAEAPVLVEVTRGGMVESRHRGSIAVVDAEGRVVAAVGAVDRPIYPRSAIKPLQAILLAESGAAERFGISDAELTLACASHNGEVVHVDAVRAWLKRIGLSEGDLECGAQMPMFEGSAHPLIRAGRQPSAAHNNCSGKHTGFLTVAVHRGYPTKGYIRPDHPVQRDLLRLFEEICDADLGATPRGIDGCGIPVFGLTLRQMALGLARLADPSRLAPERAEACRRIQAAVPAHPVMIAGTGRFDTAVLSAVGRDLIVKGGAEGVHAAALPTKGLGVAIKIEDGAGRASQAAVAATLDRLGAFTPEQTTALASTLAPGLRNWVGTSVGEIRPAADFPF